MSQRPDIPERLPPGTTLDHFEVSERIGAGGMGEVYRARDTLLGRRVAIKLIRSERLRDAGAVSRFLAEARVTARFNHPHIVTVHHVGEHDGAPFLVLELLEGETLRARLDGGLPSPAEAARIALAIADALSEAHRHGIVHRDLKPRNVMMGRDGRLRVLDFGLARLSAAAPRGFGPAAADAALGSRAGSPPYMAPEAWRFQEPTSAVDVWALGVLLYELLTGHPPWDDPDIYTLAARVTGSEPPPPLDAPDAPPGLVALALRCLTRDPAGRPTAADVKRALEQLLLPGSAPDAPRSPFRGLVPFGQRHASLFFGRDAEIARALEWLREVPALAVVGPSGAGKSSFVASGVLPRLRERGGWQILALRPGRRPFEALAARLVQGDTGSGSSEERPEPAPDATSRDRERDLVRLLREAPGRLALELERLAHAAGGRVLLFVDQLEEAHTHMRDAAERTAFLEAIGQAADAANSPVRVLVGLRDDFLGRVAEVPAMREALAQVMVIRTPGPAELTSILRRSVAAAGYTFDDPELVVELVAAIGDAPDALSLLQLVGQALWDRRDEAARTLRRSSYDALGGLEGALAAQADAVLDGSSDGEMQLARQLLLRVVDGDGNRRIVARDQLLDGLEDQAADVLERLIGARTLRVARGQRGADGGEVELVHESLVRSWPTLRRWVEEGRDELAFLAELRDAAALWRRRGRRSDEVWRGATLVAACARAERVERVPAEVAAFLGAGTRLQRRRRVRDRVILSVVTATLALTAFAFFLLSRHAATAQREAEAAATRAAELESQARAGEADALRIAADAALAADDAPTARAMVRAALERSDDHGLRTLWRRISHAEMWRIPAADMYLGHLSWSPSGDQLLLADIPQLRALDAVTGLPLATPFGGHFTDVSGLRVVSSRPDGQALLDASGSFTTLEGDDGRISWRYPVGIGIDGQLATCWPRNVAAVANREHVVVLDLATGLPRARFEGRGGIRGAVFVDACRRLVVGAWSGELWRWDPDSGATESAGRHPGGLSALGASTNGEVVATGGFDGQVFVWRPAQTEPDRVLPTTNNRLRTVALSPDGTLVAAAGEGGDIEAWDLVTGVRRRVTADGPVSTVAFRPSGRVLAARSVTSITLWAFDAGAEGPASTPGRVHGPVAFSPDGALLASRDDGSVVRLWAVPEGRRVGYLLPSSPLVFALAFSDDGTQLAASGEDRAVRVYDVPSQRLLHDLRGHGAMVLGLALSGDGGLVASASADATLRVWDLSGQGRSRVFEGHAQTVYAVAFDGPDHLLSAGKDATLRRWRLADGHMQVVAQLPAITWAWDRLPDGDLVGLDLSGALSRYDPVHFGRRTIDVPVGVSDARAEAGPAHIRALPRTPAVAVPSADRVELQYLDGRLERLSTPRPGQFLDVDRTGRYLAFQNESGTHLWDLEARAPRWWARAVVLSPRAAWTHRGWVAAAAPHDPVEVPRTRWVAAIEARAARTRVDPTGGWGCLASRGGAVERWDLAGDTRVGVSEDVTGELVAAIPGGCVVSAPDGVSVLGREGKRDLVAGPGTALADRGGLVVVTPGWARLFDVEGAPDGDSAIASEVTAAIRVGGQLGTATAAGKVAVGGVSMRGAGATPVTALAEGPGGTLVVAFVGGTVGVWDPATGGRLDGLELNGDIDQLRVDGAGVVAASRLGDVAALDLSVLTVARCDVLRDVWQRSPATWAEGEAHRRSAPVGHACAAPAGPPGPLAR